MAGYVVPVWENKTAPCGGANGCPAHSNIAGAMHALAMGDAKRAWTIMMESHPLRGVLGRVCYAFCESPCNRGSFDASISIQMLEGVMADHGFDPDWRPAMSPRNGKKILIVGAGPAGLTAGWFLNLAGFAVTIHEAEAEAGGVLRYGIPAYRLPKDVLAREVKLIEACGVTIRYNTPVEGAKLADLMKSEGFDAAVVTIGAGVGRGSGIAGEEQCLSGLTLLKRVNAEETHRQTFEGRAVIVVGGGNVAMDACRTAVRLGAASVHVLYRRDEASMPAHDFEVRHARQEGVVFDFLKAPKAYDGSTLTVEVMALAEPDDSGRRRAVASGVTERRPADVVIMAIGQEPATFNAPKSDVIFFAGDVIPSSPGTVIHAIAAGKRAAADAALRLTGATLFPPMPEEVPYEKMNIARYFERRMRLRTALEPASRRIHDFRPVERVVSLDEARVEASRCFRCGMCIGGVNSDCDWCFHACGKEGINKLMIVWDHTTPLFEPSAQCDSCGKCWEDCPRFVVTPVEVEENE
ncbi:MAG: FAD-dependent oxidoreductase [Nitrospinae bacterium]|nr:FAD-dependent oxidoreductase [Nitrospinota bacterium]